MQSIEIVVRGAPKAGKTTIAKLIEEALLAAGLTAQVTDGRDGDYHRIDAAQARLSMAGRRIHVRTEGLNREAVSWQG